MPKASNDDQAPGLGSAKAVVAPEAAHPTASSTMIAAATGVVAGMVALLQAFELLLHEVNGTAQALATVGGAVTGVRWMTVVAVAAGVAGIGGAIYCAVERRRKMVQG